MNFIEKINPVIAYRVIRLAFAGLFIWIGSRYEDGWPAYFLAVILLITAFLKPVGCVGNNCDIDSNTKN